MDFVNLADQFVYPDQTSFFVPEDRGSPTGDADRAGSSVASPPMVDLINHDRLSSNFMSRSLDDGLSQIEVSMRIIMGSSGMKNPEKESKEPETHTTQAYYSPMPPHGYMASSPQAPHTYFWGVQPMMPPYCTPPHDYMARIYAHPSLPPGSYPFSPFAMNPTNGVAEPAGNAPSSMEADYKVAEVKEKLPIKRDKRTLVNLNVTAGKNDKGGKISGASAIGGHPKSADTLSEGSSEGSDANSGNDSPVKSGGMQDSLEAEVFQKGGAGCNGGPSTSPTVMSQEIVMVHGVPSPTTNLNIDINYWGGATPAPLPTPVGGRMVNARSRERHQSQLWVKDERELKKQQRKQSNRESARRSRLKKQVEYDELAQRTEVVKDENSNLRLDLNRIRTEYEDLLAQNASLKERLGKVHEETD